MDWNAHQQAVIAQMASGEGNLLVSARAGTGKTTTIVAGSNQMRGKTLFTAFNRSTRDVLHGRLSEEVDVRTAHQLGFRLCGAHWQSKMLGDDPQKKGRMIARSVTADHGLRNMHYHAGVAASTIKNLGIRRFEDMRSVVEACGASFGVDATPDDLHRAVWDCLKAAKADTAHVDYDDMVWLPYIHNVGPKARYRNIVVDELQDMNAPQTYILGLYQEPSAYGGRTIGVGDEHQTIYQFRGAHGAFAWLQAQNPHMLSMPVSYRCSEAVVEYARQLVPDIVAAPGAPKGQVHWLDGSVHTLGLGGAEEQFCPQPGDAVLSRTNAHLMQVAMYLIRQGVPFSMMGKDMEARVRTLISRAADTGARDTKGIQSYVLGWYAENKAFLQDPAALQDKADQALTVLQIARMCRSADEMLQCAAKIFSADAKDGVTLATVHRFKGLEAPRAWLLEESFIEPDRLPEADPERHIRYVAITRAKTDLFLLGTMRATEDEMWSWQ